jgi:hypothetical protein
VLGLHGAGGGEAGSSGQGAGGLGALFDMVLGGLVGTSAHMVSASVMALARLLHAVRACPLPCMLVFHGTIADVQNGSGLKRWQTRCLPALLKRVLPSLARLHA